MTTQHSIVQEDFGKTKDGLYVKLYTLSNANGMIVKITNYGGIVVSMWVPDKYGTAGDVVLGYDSLEQYFDNESHFGAIVGRYANRIAKGEFELDGKIFTLPQNEGSNCLHSGPQNFSTVVWDAATLHGESDMGIELRHKSKHGHNGFPGTVRTIVRYFLNNSNELIIEYEATTDKTTVINLTNHSYFNLTGNHKKDILRHRLKLAAKRFTPVSANLIPVSDIYEVKDTVMDFREFREIGEHIDKPDKQLEIAGGYDHNYILDHEPGQLGIAAIVQEPETGRSMEVRTTLPGVQFYTANHFDGSIIGKSGIRYHKYTGFCLETQHFPDSPNRPDFPSTVLRPGQTYRHTTVFRFFHQGD